MRTLGDSKEPCVPLALNCLLMFEAVPPWKITVRRHFTSLAILIQSFVFMWTAVQAELKLAYPALQAH